MPSDSIAGPFSHGYCRHCYPTQTTKRETNQSPRHREGKSGRGNTLAVLRPAPAACLDSVAIVFGVMLRFFLDPSLVIVWEDRSAGCYVRYRRPGPVGCGCSAPVDAPDHACPSGFSHALAGSPVRRRLLGWTDWASRKKEQVLPLGCWRSGGPANGAMLLWHLWKCVA